MPVDMKRIDDVASVVAAIYREAETALLNATTSRLAAGLDRSGWQTSRLAAAAALRRQASSIVTALAWTGDKEIRAAIAAGYRSGKHDAVSELAGLVAPSLPGPEQLPGAAAKTASNAVQALADAAVEELRPLYSAILPQVDNVYRQAITGAAARKLAGVNTMREAAQSAYAALVSRGITNYTDTGGRQWRLHTYVEMATSTAVQRSATAGLVDEYTSRGIRLVSVDDIAGECERCRPYEHQVLALWGLAGRQMVPAARGGGEVEVDVVATLADAQAAGFMHPRCRHTIRSYLPGVSLLIKQGRTADPQGASDRNRQRAIERALRHWREMHAAALTDQAKAATAARIRAWDQMMTEHIRDTGLTRQRYREQIGAGIIPPAGRVDDKAALLGVPRAGALPGL